MKEVIGSKQYRSIVVHDKPSRRRLVIASVVLMVVAVAQLAYWHGGHTIRADYRQLTMEYAKLVEQLQIAQARYQDASQQLTNSRLGSDIDRKSVQAVRSTVGEHRQTINQLNEEINFYKGLMAPTERERGLGIRSWEVYRSSVPNRFHYKLGLQQLALKHQVLKGSVQVNVIGKRNGAKAILPLSALSELADKKLKLRFKYFQYLEGELALPKDFVAERVNIIAKATSPKAVTVDKYYDWSVEK